MTGSQRVVVSFVVFAGLGCGLAKGQATFDGPVVISKPPAAPASAPAESRIPLDALNDLSPLPSGPGVFVCDPAGKGASSDTIHFGAGAGRWLNFSLGGIPEMGRTQAWTVGRRISKELGASGKCVPRSKAVQAGKIAGVPYVMTGVICGTEAKCSLEYVLTNTETGKPLGAPMRLAGTRVRIAAELPRLVGVVATRLKVPAPAVKAPQAGDLTFMGGFDWLPSGLIAPDRYRRALEISSRLPAMGLMLLEDASVHHSLEYDGIVLNLLSATPNHPLLLSEIARLTKAQMFRVAGPVSTLRERYPNNYLLCRVQMRLDTTLKAEMASGVRLVRINPKSPLAWTNLGEVLGYMAGAVRQGRVWAAMSDEDATYVSSIYPHEAAAYARAVRLDPLYADAWEELAEAATFDGDDATADKALWKALRLDPSMYKAYYWGLEMYQPKWGGDPDKLRKMAALAGKQRFADPYQSLYMGEELERADYSEYATPHFDRAVSAFEAKVAEQPDSASLHECLGRALLGAGRRADARKEWEKVIALAPDSATAAEAGKLLAYYRDR